MANPESLANLGVPADGVRLGRLRARARWRRWAGLALLCVPVLAAVGTDFARRGYRILDFAGHYKWTYLGAVLESLVLWAVLFYVACRRAGWVRWLASVLFVAGFTLSFGGQQYFFEQYNAYLNVDVSLFASNFTDSVINQLFADIGNYLSAKLPFLLLAVGLLVLGRRVIRPRRTAANWFAPLAPAVLVASLFIPTQHRHIQAATPDVLYLHAVGGLIRTQLGFTEQSDQLRPRARESMSVPALSSTRKAPPNVVFLILESVRADATCVNYDPECQRTPYSNRLVPDRYPLTQLRSLTSSTAISLAVLWSGVLPTESREVLHEWPLLFDYARSAGYSTAFWTSQNMMFGNARLWVKNLGVDRFVSATELDPTADLDMGAPEHLLAEHVNRGLDDLPEPFLAVVQFSNAHYPYYLELDGPLPFQPWTVSKAPEDNPHFFNYYQNVVHQQDRHVASIIEHVKQRYGDDTVIVYTSDHGEAFREHNQMGHTFSVLDEEIKVPGWIDVPPGVLETRELENLADQRDAFTFHVDLPITILDVMGLDEASETAKYRTKMPGQSLLGPELPERVLPMTNCAGVWSCAFENWGIMRGNLKLEARAWDPEWHCYDVLADPAEAFNLGEAACGDLKPRALGIFGRLPGKMPE